MSSAANDQANSDRRIDHIAYRAFGFLECVLDTEEWRPLKVEQVVVKIGCSKPSAVRALHQLVACGYIAVRGHTRPREYRRLPAPMLPMHKARAA